MAATSIQQSLAQAIQHHQAGRLQEAERLYRQILAADPGHADAMQRLGLIALQRGRCDEAIDLLRSAIALAPDIPEAYNRLGMALAGKGQFDEAIAASRRAVALKPDYAEAYNNLGGILAGNKRLQEAIAAFDRAIAIRPNYAEAHANRGNAFSDMGQFKEAVEAFHRALSINSKLPEAHNNMGLALANQGETIKAMASYRRAIEFRPDYPEAHFNLAAALLARGEFQQGWQQYEWRWKCKNLPSLPRNFKQPRWDGGPIEGRTILLHAEQGFGDAIQFIRYLPLVMQRGAKVIIGTSPQLERLMRANAPQCQILTRGQRLPAFDFYCPLFDLPRVLGTTLQNIPQNVPYLRADESDIEKWRQRLAEHCQFAKVGLVWAGSPSHTNDRNRSMTLANFAPLAKTPGVRWFSLQIGSAAGRPMDMELIDWTQELVDFGETAALIANLDLVIAVDTAVAHLAGALGKPVWTLLPFCADWRWLLERQDSPWYPTMRLFRQRSLGDWDNVMSRVAEALPASVANCR